MLVAASNSPEYVGLSHTNVPTLVIVDRSLLSVTKSRKEMPSLSSPHLQKKKKKLQTLRLSTVSDFIPYTYTIYLLYATLYTVYCIVILLYKMPHTSRTKRPTIQKRTTVTDPSGWTHVTNGGNVRRVIRRQNTQEPILVPAEAPARLTLSDLQTQFQTHRERWENSESWSKVTSVLDKRLKERKNPVDAVVCIGLGSPSGFLRDGWVDRRAVSLYQLAALASIKDQVDCSFSPVDLQFVFLAFGPMLGLASRPNVLDFVFFLNPP